MTRAMSIFGVVDMLCTRLRTDKLCVDSLIFKTCIASVCNQNTGSPGPVFIYNCKSLFIKVFIVSQGAIANLLRYFVQKCDCIAKGHEDYSIVH